MIAVFDNEIMRKESSSRVVRKEDWLAGLLCVADAGVRVIGPCSVEFEK
jgi:hypothetical protein